MLFLFVRPGLQCNTIAAPCSLSWNLFETFCSSLPPQAYKCSPWKLLYFFKFKLVFLQITMYISPNYIHISVLDMFHCGWAVCMTTSGQFPQTCSPASFSPPSCPARQIPNLTQTNQKEKSLKNLRQNIKRTLEQNLNQI